VSAGFAAEEDEELTAARIGSSGVIRSAVLLCLQWMQKVVAARERASRLRVAQSRQAGFRQQRMRTG